MTTTDANNDPAHVNDATAEDLKSMSTNDLLRAILVVQRKQAQECTMLNQSIKEIIDKLALQAERDIHSMAATDKIVDKWEEHDALVTSLVDEINALKAEMETKVTKVAAAVAEQQQQHKAATESN